MSEPTAPPNFEQALLQLEAIVRQLEDGDVGLAEALARYETGIGLLKQCYNLLERAERRIELLCGVDAQGNPVTEPFDASSTLTESEKPASRGKKKSSQSAKSTKLPPKPADDELGDIDEPGGLF